MFKVLWLYLILLLDWSWYQYLDSPLLRWMWSAIGGGPATGKCGLSRAGRRRDLMLDWMGRWQCRFHFASHPHPPTALAFCFELLTFIYCFWLSTKESLSFELERQPAWIKIVCPYLPGSVERGYKITNLSCMNTKAGSHATKYFAALVLNFQLQSF